MTVGIPFKPGADERRNKGGRPKGLAARIREITDDLEEQLQIMIKISTGEMTAKCVVGRGDDQQVVEVPPSLRDRMQAIEWLADRSFGKAPEIVATLDIGEANKELAKRIASELVQDFKANDK